MILVLLNAKAKLTARKGLEVINQEVTEALAGQGEIISTHSIGELETVFSARDPGLITAVVPLGGDGTLSVAITAANKVWGADRLPPFLPVFGGTMNEIATDVHAKSHSPIEMIRQLSERCKLGKAVKTSARYPIRINNSRLGFAFGFGASSRFLERYYASGAGAWVAIKMIFDYVLSALIAGPTITALFKKCTGNIIRDGKLQPLVMTFFLALTVRNLPFGVRLSQSGGNGARPEICLVFGSASLVWLALSLPLIWLGRLPERTRLERTLNKRVEMNLDSPERWHIDGDLEPATRKLILDVGPQIRFIQF